MYISGWGFHTDWKSIVEAALIWRIIRHLRLVRVRHRSHIRTGLATVNLASLPAEIMEIVEDMVAWELQVGLSSREPFKFDLQECCSGALEDIDKWYPYEEALFVYAGQQSLDLFNYRQYQLARAQFETTSTARNLRETRLTIHHEEGTCTRLEMDE